MSRNRLYTLSYFRKRLKDANIQSKVLLESFPLTDKRYWMITITKEKNILCTCFKAGAEFEFHFTDGKQCLGQDIIIKTESMKVILEFLEKFVIPVNLEEAVEAPQVEKTSCSPDDCGKVKWVDVD